MNMKKVLGELKAIVRMYSPSTDPYIGREIADRGGDADAYYAKEEGREEVVDEINILIKDIEASFAKVSNDDWSKPLKGALGKEKKVTTKDPFLDGIIKKISLL